MANPARSGSGGARGGGPIRNAFIEEAMEAIGGVVGEGIIRLLPVEIIDQVGDRIPDSFMTDNDKRRKWARYVALAIGTPFGLESGGRNAIQEFLDQSGEELGKIRNELDGHGTANDRAKIRQAIDGKKSLLEPLRKKEQGDKVQKRALPDYFTAKAAIKDQDVQDTLTEIEAALPADKQQYFLSRGGYRVHTTPEELISIAKGSKVEDGHAYGVLRLLGLMSGQRGEGGIKAKVQSAVSDLVDEVMTGGDIGENLENLSNRARDWAKESADKRKKRRAV